jgi:Kef-type K+ transport system membrane component KefB
MEIILTLIFIILASYLATYILYKQFRIPSVVVLIIIGIILGYEPIKNMYLSSHIEIIEILGIIGLFSLMFLAGLESSWNKLIHEERDSFWIALFSLIVPLILGFVFGYYIMNWTLITSFTIGICMSITAEGTKVKELIELKKIKSRVGSAMIGSGILDDVLGLSLFTIVLFIVGKVEFKEQIVMVGIILFFVFGLLVQKFARHNHLTKKTEKIFNVFLVPFFFVSMGLHFNLVELQFSFWTILLIVIFSIIGKLLGTQIAKCFVKFNKKQLYLIGWGMNSRGAIELALALIAFPIQLNTIVFY